MNSKETEQLSLLLKSIDQRNFDLDVWKIKATLLIKKVFGEADEKLKLIEALHYDYSSWSLRDQSGSKQADTIKAQARGIIEAAIMEISVSSSSSSDQILNEFRKELTGADMDTFQQLIDSKNVDETGVIEFLGKISPEVKDRVLARLILKIDQ